MTTLPDDYQSLTGAEKRDLLWQRLSEAPYAEGQLPTRAPGLIARRKIFQVPHNRGSFEHVSDEMAPGRKKLVHAHGTVAQVTWEVTAEHPYTGIFASGGTAIMRTSDAIGGKVFAPTHALKFLIDGHPSINLFANQAEHGPPADFDAFDRRYSNSLPEPQRLDGKLVARAFQRTADALGGTRLYANYLPLHEPASQNLDGSTVAEPVVPDRIELHATGDLHTTSSRHPDWRVELAALEVGAVLFDIRIAGRIDEDAVPYGRLRLASKYVASAYGDEVLFFQHHVGPRA